MTTPTDKLTAEQRLILAGARESTEREGLEAAWRRHLPDLVREINRERPSQQSLEQLLNAWVTADAGIAPRLASIAPERATHLAGSLLGKVHEAAGLPVPPWARDLRPAVEELWGLRGQRAERHPEIREDEASGGEGMHCYRGRRFRNWGQTVRNRPSLTCIPRTRKGLCNLVKWAAANSKRVRASGYRHTWGDLYSADDEVLVSFLPLRFVEDFPALEARRDPRNEFHVIRPHTDDPALCTVGAGVTNEMFREWCVGGPKSEWKQWTLPLNVIMVEITFGGANAAICHGAGWRTQTLSDLVESIEFVNVKGELQTVDDPEQLKAAAGCFGLLGLVTSVTLRLEPMTYARMRPKTRRVALSVPPPEGFTVPAAVDMAGISAADLAQARAEFVRSCENDYYVEWFWFPYQERCWINTWQNDGTLAEAGSYPSDLKTVWQQAMVALAQVANTTVFKLLPGRTQAKMLGDAAMLALPKDREIVAPLLDALHFQRGIQNMVVLDLELEIPIPGRADDRSKPDWTICQRAWWDAIALVYRHTGAHDAPMRIALEMRITRDSRITLAPQHGNSLGTCSIEVLTTPNVDEADWRAFMQDITDAWCGYHDADWKLLNVRPHWAKQWREIRFRGKDPVRYLTDDAYAQRLPEFRQGLEAIAQAGGYTRDDLRQRFSNPLLDEVFRTVFD